MWRAVATELVATACLLFMLTTTIIACLESKETEPKLLIPIVVFVIVFLVLVVTVPLSGGHMSPVFTFIAALRGLISLVRALFYVLAQCVGSIMAYLVIKSVMDETVADKYALGGCMVNGNGAGVSTGTALVIEFACTFLVLYVAITVAFDKKMCQELGLAILIRQFGLKATIYYL
ncbi:aquaporin PIP-type [Ricinus communis]|nr:aquaporin PIP-type [Ricinus communis]